MHLRTTFFLLILTVLVLSYVFMRGSPDNNADESDKEKVKLLDLEPERVSYWSLAGDRGFVKCVNEHGQWMITKPFRTRAKDARINYILSVLASLIKGETITGDQRKARALSLADYGLAKPVYRIVLGSPDKRLEMNVGNISPLKDSIYVQIDNSDTIVAASTNLLEIIPHELSEIRDNHLLSGAPAYVNKLEIKSTRSPLIIVVKEGAEWVLRKPVLARADWLKLSALLDLLFNAQIEQYVSDSMIDPSLYGLDDDEATMQISVWQNKKDKGEHLFFGKKADEKGDLVYVCQRGQKSVFAVKSGVVKLLSVTVANIRDSRLFFMAPDSFSSIRIEEGNKILQLIRDRNSGWQITEPKKWKADDKIVETLISRLNSLRIEMFVPATNLSAQLLEKPAKIISVSDAVPLTLVSSRQRPETSAVITRTLLLSASAQGIENVYARFADEDEVYQVSASAVSTISLNPMTYRDSVVLSFNPAAVTKVVLRKNNKEQIVIMDKAGKWQAGGPEPAQVNLKIINDLLVKTASLRAMRFESDSGVAGMYGLQPASRTLTFSLSGKEGINKTLLLGGDSEDGGIYAILQGQEFVFVLDKRLVNLLLRDLLQ